MPAGLKKPALGVFFRVPESGKVKKRLSAEIGETAALQAYDSMLSATMDKISGLTAIDIYGFYEGDAARLKELPFEISFIRQHGNDLGERMADAFALLFGKKHEKVALIGSDSPDLPLSFITAAFESLDASDLVLGPSEDGGYYLIGMKKLIEGIFKGVKWGTEDALKHTIANADDAGINYSLLPEWYDIDDLESLKRWENLTLS